MSVGLDDDPLRAAGALACRGRGCGEWGYPTDAAWLDNERLLATYVWGCGHEDDLTAFIVAALAVPESQLRELRCGAPTRTGTPCRNRPRPGTTRCHAHRGGY